MPYTINLINRAQQAKLLNVSTCTAQIMFIYLHIERGAESSIGCPALQKMFSFVTSTAESPPEVVQNSDDTTVTVFPYQSKNSRISLLILRP